MLICYDKVFPEAARELALDGAGIIASLAAWPVSRRSPAARMRRDREVRHFDLLDEARAIENQVVWVSANQTGRFGRLRFPGHAKVVDPDGTVLAATGARHGMAVAEVDVLRRRRHRARDDISHLGDRQPGTYLLGQEAIPRRVGRRLDSTRSCAESSVSWVVPSPDEGRRMLERIGHRGPRRPRRGRRWPTRGWATRGCRSWTWRAATSRCSTSATSSCGWSATARSTTTSTCAPACTTTPSTPPSPTTRSRCTWCARRGPRHLTELEGMFAFLIAGDGRLLHGRARPGRHQAAVLRRVRGRHALRVRDALVRARLAPVRAGVPARALLDPRGRLRALRRGRAAPARRAPPRRRAVRARTTRRRATS